MVRTVDTLPGMQAEAQEYLPLEEVPAGEPYRMRGVAPPADNLMDRSRHLFRRIFSREFNAHEVCTTGRCSGDLF